MSVLQASQAFGSEVRLRLVRHFLEHPGSQAEAMRALGISSATATSNTKLLLDLGVLTETPAADRRARIYTVNLKRYDELVDALRRYIHPR